ncbi:MAG: DUF1688 family protein [Alphaproteobacteria bacterium]|nr:DUF1688 family protein [Alphaproteobacteria bacterium]
MDRAAAEGLLTARAVRETCRAVLTGRRLHFDVAEDRLALAADAVAACTRQAYPDLVVPYHSRWRHFVVDGQDLGRAHLDAVAGDASERARAAFELAIVSVLVDAGAGAEWRYRDRSGRELARSEGLAIASLDFVASGALSSDSAKPWQVDAAALDRVTASDLARAFQVGPDNRLVGLDGRAELLRALAAAVAAQPEVFGRESRLGNLFDRLARTGRVGADDVLAELLRRLGRIWPGRMVRAGIELGDVWPHPAVPGGLVAFHKLSQWLSYSLLEPLQWAGVAVERIDALTGLAEYRNGGMLIDLGIVVPREPVLLDATHGVDSSVVVEWRALTVALLDALLALVRARLGRPAMTLAEMLQGGTWAVGRRLAAERRRDGGPPLTVRSDGTVF